jgi:hypothetical protein
MKWWREWIIAIVFVSAGYGVLADGIAMGRSLLIPVVYSTRTIILSASGCGELTPNEWFQIAVQISNHDWQLDDEERWFIRNVINRLTVDEFAMPTPDHQVWLCNLKRRLKL